MDTNFQFSNLIGTVYRNGRVLFSPDGYSVISPVGNKISIFDLKNNCSRTISFKCQHSIQHITLNAEGTHLVVIDEGGEILYVNLETSAVIHQFKATRLAKIAEFSPCGRYLAITPENTLQIQQMGSMVNNMFRPFHLIRLLHLSPETLTSVSWSCDSRLLCIGGEDKMIRIAPRVDAKNFTNFNIAAHKGRIVCADFQKNSYDLVSVDQRGLVNAWRCSLAGSDLLDGKFDKEDEVRPLELAYEKTNKAQLHDLAGLDRMEDVTAAAFHRDSGLLVAGFANGVFVLLEAPSLSLIHNLRVSDIRISSLAISKAGDWLAIGCGRGTSAQLVVWEWQSETYVLKQQSHSERILSAEFSPDGGQIATGGEDGKLKVWSARTSFCVVTFTEHTSGISSVAWTQNGKAVLSASLDGTVRAHDLKRYRNFRTLVCPEPTQLGALAVDAAGDIVIAAAKELFSVFVWSLETGRLLDVLAGHSSIVPSISLHGNQLVTGSLDKTFKLWNVTESQTVDHTDLVCECVAIRFSPCGNLIAVLTMDSTIGFYSTDMDHVGSIDGRLDFEAGRSKFDAIKKSTSERNKSLTSICFSPDGSLLIAGGESNFVCLYSVAERLLLRKFTLTLNRSLDGVVPDINRRNFSEFGNMQLCDDSDSDDDQAAKKQLKLPGTVHSDKGERSAKPQIAVHNLSFCPTGRRFSVCSTEGVAVYSLDMLTLFDPFQLDSSTSPATVQKHLSLNEYSTALMAALKLNENTLVTQCLEATPVGQIELVCQTIPLLYAERLLKWIADGEVAYSSPHVHFYMKWIQAVLKVHGGQLKGRGDAALLTGLQQFIQHHTQLIRSMAEQNKYGLQYLVAMRQLNQSTKSS
ncbi:unnamed protein product, partial [Mesorhabditis spiculigera]